MTKGMVTCVNEIRYLICIVNRADAEVMEAFYKKSGVPVVYRAPCRGTATEKMLDLLGIEPMEKALLFTVVTREMAKHLTRRMIAQQGKALPLIGVAFGLPVRCMGGETAWKYFLEGQPTGGETADGGKEQMEAKYELIVAITDNGHTDMVMDAARGAGATGGTVIHAKGPGSRFSEKFFGVTLASEREMVLIVADAAARSAIMKAIMQETGMRTEAHTVAFSIPVTDIAGFRQDEAEDEIPGSTDKI